jgi:MFS transporter, PPP family, 3-phenylpropionic acid transporter
LKLLYIGYFGAFGISIPFFPTYLCGLGLTGAQVAMLLGVAPLFHLGVPLFWGWVADRTRRPDLLLRLACAGAALALVPFAWARTLPGLLGAYAVHQFFAVPTLGLMDSLALDRARATGSDYTRLRLWGSASFLLVCWLAGLLFTARGAPGGDPLVPLLMAAGYALAAIAALRVRGEPGRLPPHLREVAALLSNRRFLYILLLAPLHWATLAPYHGFLGILALHRGFAPSTISHAFVVSVIAEIAAFFYFPALRRRFPLTVLLAVGAAATSLRWLLVVLTDSAPALIALQALHALSFGVFWGSAMAWVAESVPPQLRATGQALFTTAVFGLGNLLGFSAAGLLFDAGTRGCRPAGASAGPTPAFAAAAAFELLPLIMALIATARRTVPGHPRAV